ncbi:putative phage abortive infection protein, partial [Sphingobium sp. 3R8]|uniref:putative phage abortive infection protein n=1 Tax=Sphingobium sp. 3R8 TaxID=2874921 RepID=UPI001CCBF2EA|nr:putative phage abortive infection protein [Sphingobium sp. 3R8]
MSPYFRIIYTILYRIKSDKYLIDKEKFQYSNLLRSQLTSRELTVLALNATS